ncbi:hypothetical protein HU200_009196 [Digitaria exilis]|uniref:Uncharacterized protein n=1 Tax=Digitaria exilis TaxID=1010633 RepID=A0A835FJH8_9POAL|nr:hypothetical protein HU200_009196 [Digitaria exilis]
MCDATGIGRFISAVADLARGLPSPTVAPAACPPRPALDNGLYHDAVPLRPRRQRLPSPAMTWSRVPSPSPTPTSLPSNKASLHTSVVAVAIWRSRTVALDLIPAGDHMRLGIVANTRRMHELQLPAGYYGNACVLAMATATAGALRDGTLGDAVELVREAKALVTAEFVRSTADLFALRGRPNVSPTNLLVVSDCRHAGFHTVDFGWGQPVYGGPIHKHELVSALLSTVKNGDEEDVMVLPLTLTRPAMDRFVSEIDMLERVHDRSGPQKREAPKPAISHGVAGRRCTHPPRRCTTPHRPRSSRRCQWPRKRADWPRRRGKAERAKHAIRLAAARTSRHVATALAATFDAVDAGLAAFGAAVEFNKHNMRHMVDPITSKVDIKPYLLEDVPPHLDVS